MAVLSDVDLSLALAGQQLVITPSPSKRALQPASIDLRLGHEFLVFPETFEPIDPRQPNAMAPVRVEPGEPFELAPGGFALGATIEHVAVGFDLAARLEGKSSIGRLGIEVHSTAGWIDPGFEGAITLEIKNVAPRPVLLWPGMWIAQLAAFELTGSVRHPYGTSRGSNYQGQSGPTPSASYRQFATLPRR